MIMSMTGFASARGDFDAYAWQWELRGVNAKGLDVRLRIPDWVQGLETALRADIAKAVKRGNIALSLRVTRTETESALRLNTAALDSVLEAMEQVEQRAEARGMVLSQSKASDLLGLRGIWEAATDTDDTAPLLNALREAFKPLLDEFVEMRRTEGAALQAVLDKQLSRVEQLAADAAKVAEARKGQMAEALQANLERVLGNSDGADPDRVAQELALLVVKSDVTEEIDRLGAHVSAARELVATGGLVGRKLDFLMQEFNREANTLCSKSQSKDLTAIGLELKAVIDQIREQVQNVE